MSLPGETEATAEVEVGVGHVLLTRTGQGQELLAGLAGLAGLVNL